MTLYDDVLRWKGIMDSQSAEIEAFKAAIEESKMKAAANEAEIEAGKAMQRLTRILVDEGRFNDLKTALEDETYRQKLMAEHNL